ncbi:MAG: phosphatase PAP2 family protein [Planctomycetaceae bacterium]|nr:phosphatase PAP2 family protein [Planctomycetaceae bacterium]
MPTVRIAVFLLCFSPFGLCAQSILNTAPPPTPTFFEAFRLCGNRERDRIFADYGNMYNRKNAMNYGIAVFGAGIMANTSVDENFQRWHGKNINSGFSKELSELSKVFGEGKYFIPIMVTSAFTYRFWQEKKGGVPECPLGTFADRTMRGYFVGAPTLLTMQLVLGGDRPRDGGRSYWKPFQHSHGVSGHAFMGAVPFITAAQMSDNLFVKGLFYTLSIFCAWSRVNDDAHYLSQAVLGWYLGYLSVRAVSATESLRPLPRGLTIFPVCDGNAVGAGVLYRY